MAPMQIDFVSDVVCPWCFIGLARLDEALTKAGIPRDVLSFHPFQLDPSTPPEGADLRERLRAKYGVDPEVMFGRVEAAAKEAGLCIDFGKVRRHPNTLKAHTLIGAALDVGKQYEVARALFEAHFLEGQDIGDTNVLAAVASRSGVEAERATAIVSDEAALAKTRAEARAFAEQGIGGVPFILFEGRFAVSGAQPPEVFAHAIERAKSLPLDGRA